MKTRYVEGYVLRENKMFNFILNYESWLNWKLINCKNLSYHSWNDVGKGYVELVKIYVYQNRTHSVGEPQGNDLYLATRILTSSSVLLQCATLVHPGHAFSEKLETGLCISICTIYSNYILDLRESNTYSYFIFYRFAIDTYMWTQCLYIPCDIPFQDQFQLRFYIKHQFCMLL